MKKVDTFRHIVDKHTEKYNERYAEHGDDNKALGWPSMADNRKRFATMTSMIPWARHIPPVSILDFGCGLGHYVNYLRASKLNERVLFYTGVDINSVFIDICMNKYPGDTFARVDILDDADFAQLPDFDYVICNGVFTEKLDTPWQDQWDYFTTIVKRLWSRAKHGLAFNVMSPVVDYERDDLFHVPFDDMARFVRFILGSRKFTFRHDYGLWEYTTYVYRE